MDNLVELPAQNVMLIDQSCMRHAGSNGLGISMLVTCDKKVSEMGRIHGHC